MNYYVADGSTQRGPFELEALRAQGLAPDTLVWREGSPSWLPAAQVDELVRAGVVAGLGPAAPSAPAAAPHSGGGGGGGAPYPPPPADPYAGHVPYANPTGHVPPYNPNDSKRIIAGVLGIVLGSLGIHKFVLGYTAAGVIMLVVTVVVGTLTCGISWPVMWVIGLVEGIIYLTKSDEEFYHTYIARKREWF